MHYSVHRRGVHPEVHIVLIFPNGCLFYRFEAMFVFPPKVLVNVHLRVYLCSSPKYAACRAVLVHVQFASLLFYITAMLS